MVEKVTSYKTKLRKLQAVTKVTRKGKVTKVTNESY